MSALPVFETPAIADRQVIRDPIEIARLNARLRLADATPALWSVLYLLELRRVLPAYELAAAAFQRAKDDLRESLRGGEAT